MADSGLEDLMRLVYPGDVTYIMYCESYYKALSGHFLIYYSLCCYLFKNVITEEDLVDMACYIAKCSNDKLSINHKNRVVQDVSEKKRRSSRSYHRTVVFQLSGRLIMVFICLTKDFIRAERQHDFHLHLAIVAKMSPIFVAAGRGQYSKALRLYLEQMTVQESQYGALVKTFKVVGLHTWTDLLIEE